MRFWCFCEVVIWLLGSGGRGDVSGTIPRDPNARGSTWPAELRCVFGQSIIAARRSSSVKHFELHPSEPSKRLA